MNLLALMASQEWEKSRARRAQVVLPKDEFPSSKLGWLRQGFEPVWVEPEPDETYPADKILATVGPRTRAVVTSQVQYKTGARCDVETIAGELRKKQPRSFDRLHTTSSQIERCPMCRHYRRPLTSSASGPRIRRS